MFFKPKRGQRVECTKHIYDYEDPKLILIRKGWKGTVRDVRGPIGVDVYWDHGVMIPIDKKDIKKI